MRMVHLISSFVCLSRPARGLLFSPRATPASVPLARHMHVHWSRLHVRSLSTTTTSGGSEGRVVSSWSGPPAQPPVDREGEVVIQQEDLPLQLDVLALEEVLRRLLKLTGCAHMDVGVSLTNDANIKELNGRCSYFDVSSLYSFCYLSIFTSQSDTSRSGMHHR
jgi:hypothetical protein